MRLQEYQSEALATAVFPGRGEFLGLLYCALGLNGEAGEVAEKLKKVLRDNSAIMQDYNREPIKLELGDYLWYLAVLASELGFTLEDVAKANVEKLQSRKARGVLGGSGDLR